MFKIPFKWLPASWGLKGKTREIAKAEYELSGPELEYRLLDINTDDYASNEYKKANWDLDLKYGKITKDEYHRKLVTLIDDEGKRALAELELDFRAGKVGDLEYGKKAATLKNEPWVNVVSMDFGGKTALEGSFELDWNEAFVAKLKSEGYVGPSPDNIVNQWFITVCRNVAMEEFDGTGDFTADSESNLETYKRWSSEQTIPGKRVHK